MNLWVGRAWAVSVIAIIALLALAPRRPRARDVFVAICFLPLAAASVRMVPWWLLAVAPVLATAIARSLATLRGRCKTLTKCHGLLVQPCDLGAVDTVGRANRGTFGACAMVALIAFASVASLPSLEKLNPILGTLRPSVRTESNLQAVLDELKRDRVASAHVFTRLEWGEYLDWAGRSKRLSPFMDGRIEIYGDDLWHEYHVVSAGGEGWQSILNAHGIDYLILDRVQNARLLSRVAASGEWLPLARSGPAILYGRLAAPSEVFASTRAESR
jgi:hypothetical protein